MANKTGKTENKKSKTVPVLGAVLAVLAVAMIAALCLPRSGIADFIPPPFEQNAVSGVPEVAEALGYSSPYKEGMSYRFSVCGNVKTEGSDAVVYLTNPAENNVWLKVRILDADGKALGDSGIIKPGEYVRSVSLSSVPAAGTKIKLKIMGYEPDTYHSAGSATLNTVMGGAAQ